MIESSKMPPLKIGFIGGSINSAVGYAHFSAIRSDGLYDLVAGCFSRNAETNQKSAQIYGVETDRTYPDWQSLLAQEQTKLDAILVLTPTPNHDEIVISALEQGYRVICEKALTDSVPKAQKIADIVRQTSGFLAVTYNYSGYPIVREMREVIREGKLGKVQQIQIEMPQEGFLRTNKSGQPMVPQEWRLKDGEIPTLHLDLGVHVHQLIHYLTRLKPEEVVANVSNLGSFENIIDDLNAIVKYEDELTANIWYSKSALGHRNGLKIRVYGDQASMEWLQADPEHLQISYADGRREIHDRAIESHACNSIRYSRFKPGHPAGYVEAFANLYADIHHDILSYQETGASCMTNEVFGVDLSLEGLQLLDAMTQSAKHGRWVKVEK
ncbi:Gfo/Idh/MocA family protein [Hirschia baltica]|uniref:Oxidoreductase domain protein n=1 Tax=Hirschia baltica (strain ATCC 49814 / DSM 5838 / IFAM 1418) TaxID=582402 RepID=C6XMU0_HIRBI|nr:Gfo/Idh/MocA family oxidoreductase [Hirschia baltica]ACT60004.1 oxidoreductase domain protein [Hirschia baltica ATCC 49814]